MPLQTQMNDVLIDTVGDTFFPRTFFPRIGISSALRKGIQRRCEQITGKGDIPAL